MPIRSRLITAAALIPLLAGCSDLRSRLITPSSARVPASVEVIDETPPAPAPEVRRVPQQTPFGPSKMSRDEAQRVFGNDPLALRFLAVRALAEDGLLPGADLTRRVNTNIGALLPLTAIDKPAMGLDAPIPPLTTVQSRFAGLDDGTANGPAAARAVERDFLLDQLLPAYPDERMVLAPHDKQSGRAVLQRLARLEEAGLITPDERTKEAQAIEVLIAGLPEKLEPPPPPSPPKKKTVARGGGAGSGTNATRRMPGGVSGKLEVIPSPLSFEPPKITADFKGSAGAHLLSMASATHGDKAWEALQNQFKAELAGLSHKVSRTDLGELGVTYRLIVGPMEASAAERLCGGLRQKGQACMPTPFPE